MSYIILCTCIKVDKPIVNNIFLVKFDCFVYSWKHEFAKLLKLEGASRLRCKIPEVFMISPTFN